MSELYQQYAQFAGIKPENVNHKTKRFADNKSRDKSAERLIRDWFSPHPQPDIEHVN